MGNAPINITPVAYAIPFDNSTNGFVSNNVQAAIEEASHKLGQIEVSSTASASAPLSTDALMTGMSITPAPGSYIAWFSTDITSAVSGAAISVSFYIAGVQDASSLRKIIPFSGGTLTSGNGRGAISFQRSVVITTGQTIEVRWSTSSAGPTCASRTFTLLRVL